MGMTVTVDGVREVGSISIFWRLESCVAPPSLRKDLSLTQSTKNGVRHCVQQSCSPRLVAAMVALTGVRGSQPKSPGRYLIGGIVDEEVTSLFGLLRIMNAQAS